MADRLAFVLGEEPAHPAHPFLPHDVVGVHLFSHPRQVRNVPADDDGGLWQMRADQLAHLLHLPEVRYDGADPDHIVAVSGNLLDKAIQRGEIQQRAGGVEIGLNQHDAPGAVEHPKGKGPLHPGHLVVIQLHRIDRPTAVLIVLGIGPEHAGQ